MRPRRPAGGSASERPRCHARRARARLRRGERAARTGARLWPRVTEDARPQEIDHVDLLARAAKAYGSPVTGRARRILLDRALEALDPERETQRYAAVLGACRGSGGRLKPGRLRSRRQSRRSRCWPPRRGPRTGAVVGLACANARSCAGATAMRSATARVRQARAIEAGDSLAECEVNNTLGMAQAMLGRVDEGVASLRRAIEIARQNEDVDSVSTACSNLAEAEPSGRRRRHSRPPRKAWR